ncbi:MAG: ribonuclease III [Candidatus Gastranaerophilales bacterium]|nr:ribonuclease III [Candidatus Gastranaerophilales bacterium]
MVFNLLDIKCNNKETLEIALTHPSYTKENQISSLKNYERLEFLGDAVLKLIISKLLYNKYPEYKEGELSKIRSILVSDNILSKLAIKIGIDKIMKLGSGEENTGGRTRESNIACVMEAVLGAYYLDGKINYIEDFLKAELLPKSDEIDKHFEKYNAKAVLQEYTQKESNTLPVYTTINISGPNHKPEFEVSVKYNDNEIATGKGYSKKEAQQNCAYQACINLKIIKEEENNG